MDAGIFIRDLLNKGIDNPGLIRDNRFGGVQ